MGRCGIFYNSVKRAVGVVHNTHDLSNVVYIFKFHCGNNYVGRTSQRFHSSKIAVFMVWTKYFLRYTRILECIKTMYLTRIHFEILIIYSEIYDEEQ